MHNNYFGIFPRGVHYSAKLQIANIHKTKCYLYKASWEFGFSYKLNLAQTLVILFKTQKVRSHDKFRNEWSQH